MKKLTISQILDRMKKINFEKFDLIIAIAKDGIMPASLLSHLLKTPAAAIWLNYRDEDNKPIRKEPILTKPFKKIKNKKILLVDAVSKTGKTLSKAKEILEGNKIKTFVVNGKADYNMFNYKECINFLWG